MGEVERVTLLEAVNRISEISDEKWLNTLSSRKIKELEFHNRDRSEEFVENVKSTDTYEKFYGNRKYYSATSRSKLFVEEWVKSEAKGNVFLDYACGNGGNALLAAKCGSELSLGLDISNISIDNAKNLAISEGIETARLQYFQADAENTKLPDNSIDRIICSGMLHHLDLSFAIPELRRILKPGGKILAVEALDYNPLIKFYRKLTPDMRTDWEKAHILSLKDVAFISRFFEVEEIRFWHITGIIGGKWPFLLPALSRIDKILERLPLIQRLSWIFTFVVVRTEES